MLDMRPHVLSVSGTIILPLENLYASGAELFLQSMIYFSLADGEAQET